MSQASASSTSGVYGGAGQGAIVHGPSTGLLIAVLAAAVLVFWLFLKKK